MGAERRLRTAALTLVLALTACGAPTTPTNVVIICIDTLRADHLSAYGYARETSPNIDALAAEGVLFERALAHSSWTLPATASLLTSLYPRQHGAFLEGDVKRFGDGPLPNEIRADVTGLGKRLQQAGLRTALFSGNPFLRGRFGDGFDTTDATRQDATSLTDKALAWLGEPGYWQTSQARGSGFFLYVQYMDLHQPTQPPPNYYAHFEVEGAGARSPAHADWDYRTLHDPERKDFQDFRAHRIATYDGAMRFVDAQIQRLRERVRELGFEDSTLWIVTSDHGEEFWDHAEIERQLGGDPRNIWGTGHGHSMFQELLHVPLIFAGPGVVRGVRERCWARHIDVAPSVLDLLGQPIPDAMRGRSLRALLAGGGDCEDVPLVAESPAFGPDTQAVIWKNHKLISRLSGEQLLFALDDDPDERRDLSDERPALRSALQAVLERELGSAPSSAEGGEPMDLDEETLEELRALGYL